MSSPDTEASTPEIPQPRIDTSRPHSARTYNYWLGGKDHFEADRAAGDAIANIFPHIRTAAIQNRKFMQRAVRYLAAEAGIGQFLDIGTGIPAPDNTHEIAQAINPTARVVYVDNDPIVMTHARALLNSRPDGATAYVEGDLRRAIDILRDPELTRTLDQSRPVALMLVAILHFIPDDDDPYAIVAGLLDALPSGSYLVASHATFDFMAPDHLEKVQSSMGSGRFGPFHPRTLTEFARFLDRLDLVPPGIIPVADWRPEDESAPRPTPAEANAYGAVARIP